jgi:hypothetical protein
VYALFNVSAQQLDGDEVVTLAQKVEENGERLLSAKTSVPQATLGGERETHGGSQEGLHARGSSYTLYLN